MGFSEHPRWAPPPFSRAQKRLVNGVAIGAYALGWASLVLLWGVKDHLPHDELYLPVLVGGAVILVAWAGWHALWLYPTALIAVAIAYEWWFWDVPADAEVGEWGPTTLVSLACVLAVGGIVPVFLLALLRAAVTDTPRAPGEPTRVAWPSKDPADYR